MFIGFFIIGFIAGYIIGMTGAFGIAKRNEANAIQRGTEAVERFKATRTKPAEPLPDYHESVPNSWRDDLK
tara:strand:- start:1213 stop:1425 length:213 start_codon:yes stop_codon:yes gene_type:complete